MWNDLVVYLIEMPNSGCGNTRTSDNISARTYQGIKVLRCAVFSIHAEIKADKPSFLPHRCAREEGMGWAFDFVHVIVPLLSPK